MSTNEKLVPGMVLGRYELLVPIAQGGMATVWAARQRGTRGFSKTVAIKTMLPALSEDVLFEQMFLDEAALAARIHHPNVAEILDLGEQDEILYIVMEWVDGEALSVLNKALRKNRAQVPMRLSLRIALQACAALHAAHELRDENERPLLLVHRDVSPQNILCTYDGIVKLVDFGVAKAVGRAGGETSAGQLKGKVPFMSPEQARGGIVDRRTDVFALGIVLYKLTTEQHPFIGENDLATMRNIISRPVLPPRVKNPSFPRDVEQILVKCLQKEPDKRYQTMVELGQALDRVLAGMGVADDDLGAFVRSTMGDRGAKRRAEIRDAVRVADERYATGVHAMVTPPPPTTHEHISDAVLTKMSSGVKDEPLSERPSINSGVTAPPSSHTPAPPSSSSWPGGELQPSDPHSATQQAVIVTTGGARRGRRAGLVLGVAAALAAAVLGVVVLRSGGAGVKGQGASAGARTTRSATAAVPTAAPASASASASVSASASASATATSAPSTVAVSVTASAEAPEKPKPRFRGAAAPAKSAADPDSASHNLSNGKVPIYTNPGF